MATRPGQPSPDLASSAEVRAWIVSLEAAQRSVGLRNRLLLAALLVGVLLLGFVSLGIYRSSVRSYAVLEDVAISREPPNQGRLDFSFRVTAPGKVFYRRTSGSLTTEVVDYFDQPGEVHRTWSWVYEPGRDIDVSLQYRQGFWRRTASQSFSTARQADIVVLIDTTGSMGRSINVLKEKCVGFSNQLKQQALEHRFALIGFGDTAEDAWLDKYDFTTSAAEFQKRVAQIKRFDGGDLPESALDAIEVGLSLPFAKDSLRRFYLVTDAQYHEPSQSGAKAADIARRLKQANVVLNVFSRSEFEADYKPLLGDSGKFQKLEDFGAVLTEGRILED
jgi:hypothetical protein